MDFGITFKGDISPKRTVALCKQAEVAGFKYGWFFDSHVLWRECYLTMALCMAHTDQMIFGPLVTNPGVREWSVAGSMYATLAVQSGNRIEIGIGRGDSSRRMLGKKPMTVANMERFADVLRGLTRGDEVAYDDTTAQFPWANGYELPIWIAAYGPKALAGAGRSGDGLVIQLAEPGLVKWFSQQAIAGGEAAGKDMSNLSDHVGGAGLGGRHGQCARANALVPGDGGQSRSGHRRALRHGQPGHSRQPDRLY